MSDHGTYGAYQRHIKGGTEPCEPCRAANRDYARNLRASRPELREMERVRNGARDRAAWRLVEENRQRFQQLYLEEMRKLRETSEVAS